MEIGIHIVGRGHLFFPSGFGRLCGSSSRRVVWFMDPVPDCTMVNVGQISKNLFDSLEVSYPGRLPEPGHGHDRCSDLEPSKCDSPH